MHAFLYAAIVFAAFVLILIFLTAAATFYYRKEKVIRYAQPMFLFLLLVGLMFSTIGSIFYAVEPSKAVCTSENWFVVIGFSLALVPMIVKVSTINTLFRRAKKMKRVQIKRTDMYKRIGIVLLVITIFLITWTIVDMPTEKSYYILTDSENDSGGNIVQIGLMCGSSGTTTNGEFGTFSVWYVIRFSYQFFLLVAAAVLAFQTRNVRQEFNESSRLAFVVYSHFFFFVFQLVIWGLQNYRGTLDYSLASGTVSFILSLDALVTLCIYFVPKLYTASKKEKEKPNLYTRALNGGFGTTPNVTGMKKMEESLKNIFGNKNKSPKNDSKETDDTKESAVRQVAQRRNSIDSVVSHLSSDGADFESRFSGHDSMRFSGHDSMESIDATYLLDADALKKKITSCQKRLAELEEILKIKTRNTRRYSVNSADNVFDSEGNVERRASLTSTCSAAKSLFSGVMSSNPDDAQRQVDFREEEAKKATLDKFREEEVKMATLDKPREEEDKPTPFV